MDRDLGTSDAERAAPATPAAQPSGAPERIAMLYRRVMAARQGRSPAVDLPDLAGCYDYDL